MRGRWVGSRRTKPGFSELSSKLLELSLVVVDLGFSELSPKLLELSLVVVDLGFSESSPKFLESSLHLPRVRRNPRWWFLLRQRCWWLVAPRLQLRTLQWKSPNWILWKSSPWQSLNKKERLDPELPCHFFSGVAAEWKRDKDRILQRNEENRERGCRLGQW